MPLINEEKQSNHDKISAIYAKKNLVLIMKNTI